MKNTLENKLKSEIRKCSKCENEVSNPFLYKCPRCMTELSKIDLQCTSCNHKSNCPTLKTNK